MTQQAREDYGPVVDDSDEEIRELKAELEEVQGPQGSWRKNKARRQKTEYRTADEVAKKSDKNLIIDMTSANGPRKVASMQQLDTQGSAATGDKARKLPELQYNLRTLVDFVEVDLQKFDRQLQAERRRKERLEAEKERVRGELGVEDGQVARLTEMMEELALFQSAHSRAKPATLDEVKALLKSMQKRFYDEYHDFGVYELAAPLCLPQVGSALGANM